MKMTFEFKEVKCELPNESGNVLCLLKDNTFVELYYSKENEHFRKSAKYYKSTDTVDDKVIAWSKSTRNKNKLIAYINYYQKVV